MACTPLALLAAAGLLDYAPSTLVTFSAPVMAVLRPVLLAVMAFAVAVGLLRAIDAPRRHRAPRRTPLNAARHAARSPGMRAPGARP